MTRGLPRSSCSVAGHSPTAYARVEEHPGSRLYQWDGPYVDVLADNPNSEDDEES